MSNCIEFPSSAEGEYSERKARDAREGVGLNNGNKEKSPLAKAFFCETGHLRIMHGKKYLRQAGPSFPSS